MQFELQGHDTRFTLGEPGTVQKAPAKVTQLCKDAMDPRPWDNEGGGTTLPPPGQAMQASTTLLTPLYLGMSAAIQKWGTGGTVSHGRELAWQRGVKGEKIKIIQFQEMAGALQEFKTYLFIKKGECILHYNSFANKVHGT